MKAPSPNSRFSTANLHNLSRSILDRSKRVLLSLCLLGFLLIETHIVSPEFIMHPGYPRKIILTILVLLLAVIVFIIFETHDDVGTIAKTLASLQQTLKGNLNLVGAMEDLSRELKSVKPNERIIMRHLALNLEQSWDYIRRYFLEHRNLQDIEVYLLMLPKDPKELQSNSPHPVPEEVERWCDTVEKKIKAIERNLNELKPILQRDRKKLKVLIKHYRTIPIVHGYSASGRFRFYYFSFCHWVRGEGDPKYWAYDWGENDYHKFVGDPNDVAFGDLAKVFDGQFDFLWATSQDLSVNFYHGREPDADHSIIPQYD